MYMERECAWRPASWLFAENIRCYHKWSPDTGPCWSVLPTLVASSSFIYLLVCSISYLPLTPQTGAQGGLLPIKKHTRRSSSDSGLQALEMPGPNLGRSPGKTWNGFKTLNAQTCLLLVTRRTFCTCQRLTSASHPPPPTSAAGNGKPSSQLDCSATGSRSRHDLKAGQRLPHLAGTERRTGAAHGRF